MIQLTLLSRVCVGHVSYMCTCVYMCDDILAFICTQTTHTNILYTPHAQPHTPPHTHLHSWCMPSFCGSWSPLTSRLPWPRGTLTNPLCCKSWSCLTVRIPERETSSRPYCTGSTASSWDSGHTSDDRLTTSS